MPAKKNPSPAIATVMTARLCVANNRIKNAAVSAFCSEGALVYDCGLCATPAMFMAVVSDIKACASLEITASHHPYQKNGLKFLRLTEGLKDMKLRKY